MKKIIGAGDCPKCGSRNLNYGDYDLDNDCIGYEYSCGDCNFEGTEWHTIKFSNHVDENNNEMPSEIEINQEATT